MVEFQVRAHRSVASPRFGSARWAFAPIKAWICAVTIIQAAYIRERIAKIESDAALSALPTIRKVLDEAGSTTVDRIRNGSFKQACKAVDCFADTVLKLSRVLSQKS
jgi:hypothetical protein